MPIIGTVMLEMMLGMAMRSISLLIFITEGKDKNKMRYLGARGGVFVEKCGAWGLGGGGKNSKM